MKEIATQIIRFVGLVLLQIFIFGQIEFLSIHPMIYPVFIMLLPFSIRPIFLLLIAFCIGILIDIFSNTGGLHASSLLIFALCRPFIFNLFRPRDGYDQFYEGSIYEMGHQWFFYCFGSLLMLHHAWFFFMETFKWSDILYTLQKIGLTLPVSYLSVILLQFLFIHRK